MSTATEIAEREAAEAEAEQPEEEEAEAEEEPQPEPEPEPEPQPQALTDTQAEREFAKLEKLATTYLGKALPITKTLGMPVEMCPLCTFPGLAIPRGEHEVTSDVVARVLGLIGRNVEPEYKTSEGYRVCDVCGGWGEVLTGARKEISRTATCPNPNCGGKGYVQVPITVAPPNGAPPYPGAAVPFTPLPGGIPDQWGRPAGHVHWGIDPANVGA